MQKHAGKKKCALMEGCSADFSKKDAVNQGTVDLVVGIFYVLFFLIGSIATTFVAVYCCCHDTRSGREFLVVTCCSCI